MSESLIPSVDLKVHVDTDGGVDDALALVALVRAGAMIDQISAVFGNTYVDQAAANARGVLRLSGYGVDVYIGAGASLTRRKAARLQPAHGVDGLNGVGFSQRWKLPVLARGAGVSLLSFCLRRGLEGLFLGPLTNLADTLLEHPADLRGWSPVIMAGAFGGQGRAPGGSDFNSWSDPEALHRVLDAGIQPRLVPLDVTFGVTLQAQALEAAAARGGPPLMQRLARAVWPYARFQSQFRGLPDGTFSPHDAVTAGALLWPELYRFEPCRLRVQTHHDPSPGRIERLDGPPNAFVCTAINAAAVTTRLSRLLGLDPPPTGAA
ncbi:MAG: nucleoside hydrolase [Asticcacaulis sp.]